MTGGPTSGETRIELYVRSLRPSSESDQARAMDRLDALVAEGTVRSYRVLVWGGRAPPTRDEARTAAGKFVLDRVSAFREWARRNDASVAAPFAVRDVDSGITGESYGELVLPRLVLAAYSDGELARVVPHERDGTTTSVREYLTRLGEREGEGESEGEGALPEMTTVDRGPTAVTVAGGLPETDPEGVPDGEPAPGRPDGEPASGRPDGEPASGRPDGEPAPGRPDGEPTTGPGRVDRPRTAIERAREAAREAAMGSNPPADPELGTSTESGTSTGSGTNTGSESGSDDDTDPTSDRDRERERGRDRERERGRDREQELHGPEEPTP